MNNFFQQFGGKVTKELEAQYAQSPNWQKGAFQNLVPTSLSASLWDIPKIIYKQFSNSSARRPSRPLPIIPFDKEAFLAPSEESKFIWYGHSAILMRLLGKTVLIDPMLGPDTTPIAPSPNPRFSENTLDLIDAFPAIDLVLMTHDHYDHLDYSSIQRLQSKTKRYFVALGVKRHLVHWGVAPELVTEFDWWDQQHLEEIAISFTPTRHFSGRGLTDRSKTLWGGWVFQLPHETIWFSGDGGYGDHFKAVQERFGGFDLAFMECGQYNDDWKDIHLFPDESVQAALDAGVKKAVPVHWCGFDLSYQHTWQEPANTFVQTAIDQSLDYGLPRLGELFTAHSLAQEPWWSVYA